LGWERDSPPTDYPFFDPNGLERDSPSTLPFFDPNDLGKNKDHKRDPQKVEKVNPWQFLCHKCSALLSQKEELIRNGFGDNENWKTSGKNVLPLKNANIRIATNYANTMYIM